MEAGIHGAVRIDPRDPRDARPVQRRKITAQINLPVRTRRRGIHRTVRAQRVREQRVQRPGHRVHRFRVRDRQHRGAVDAQVQHVWHRCAQLRPATHEAHIVQAPSLIRQILQVGHGKLEGGGTAHVREGVGHAIHRIRQGHGRAAVIKIAQRVHLNRTGISRIAGARIAARIRLIGSRALPGAEGGVQQIRHAQH